MGIAMEGVERDLSVMPADIAGSGLAAIARVMAEKLDGGKGSPSECAKALMQALEQLRGLAPAKREFGELDALRAAREARLAGRKSAA